MRLFKKKLELYEADCIRAVRNGRTLRPLPAMIVVPSNASMEDWKRVEDNYLIANAIYERYASQGMNTQ